MVNNRIAIDGNGTGMDEGPRVDGIRFDGRLLVLLDLPDLEGLTNEDNRVLLLMTALQSFGGLRPSEALNLSMDIVFGEEPDDDERTE